MGADGKGHVAWWTNPTGATPSFVTYCRVPAGGGPCEVKVNLAFPTAPMPEDVQVSGPASVFVDGTSIVVYSSCYLCGPAQNANRDRTMKWTSADGGSTWPNPAVEVHSGGAAGDTSQSLLLGTGTSAIFAFTNPAKVFAGTEPFVNDATTSPMNTAGFDYNESLAAVPGGTKIVAARDNLSDAQFNVFADPTPGAITAAELETFGNWSGPSTLTGGGGGSQPALAGGPAGTTLIYVENSTVNSLMTARRFDAGTNTFQAPVAISAIGTTGGIYSTDVAQSSAGTTNAVWEQGDPFRLLRSTSPDAGATWTAPQRLVTGRAVEPEVEANAGGVGFAIYNQSPVFGPVTIVPLSDAAADVAPPVTPAPTPTAPPRTPGTGTIYTPGGSPGVATQVKQTGSGGEYTFVGPKTCVPRGTRFSVTLRVKKQKRKGNLFVKVTKVDFYVGTRKVKTDKKAPFKQTLTATATAAKGSTIRVRARAFIKVRKTRRVPKKSVTLRIRICS